MTEALVTYLGSRDRGETTSGPKLTSVLTLSSLGRPGSPPPELLTWEGTRIAEFCKWHFSATLPYPKSGTGMALGKTSFFLENGLLSYVSSIPVVRLHPYPCRINKPSSCRTTVPAFQDPELYRTILERLKIGVCLLDRQRERFSYGTTARNVPRATSGTKSLGVPRRRTFSSIAIRQTVN
jgi:hypothetical protein